jgi:hypothetical protein
MARIGTIKLHYIEVRPEFFKFSELQDLEIEYPELRPMMVYLGLRALSNGKNQFLWDNALIKKCLFTNLDIKIGKTLSLLQNKGFIEKQTDNGKVYGILVDTEKYTRISRYIGLRNEETEGYADWRLSVMERDLFTCQNCGKTACKLQVHHIKPYKDYPELRTDTSNGITLCVECHKKAHRQTGGKK